MSYCKQIRDPTQNFGMWETPQSAEHRLSSQAVPGWSALQNEAKFGLLPLSHSSVYPTLGGK